MNRVPFKVESCTLPEWLKGDVVSSFNEGNEADSNSPKIKLHKKRLKEAARHILLGVPLPAFVIHTRDDGDGHKLIVGHDTLAVLNRLFPPTETSRGEQFVIHLARIQSKRKQSGQSAIAPVLTDECIEEDEPSPESPTLASLLETDAPKDLNHELLTLWKDLSNDVRDFQIAYFVLNRNRSLSAHASKVDLLTGESGIGKLLLNPALEHMDEAERLAVIKWLQFSLKGAQTSLAEHLIEFAALLAKDEGAYEDLRQRGRQLYNHSSPAIGLPSVNLVKELANGERPDSQTTEFLRHGLQTARRLWSDLLRPIRTLPHKRLDVVVPLIFLAAGMPKTTPPHAAADPAVTNRKFAIRFWRSMLNSTGELTIDTLRDMVVQVPRKLPFVDDPQEFLDRALPYDGDEDQPFEKALLDYLNSPSVLPSELLPPHPPNATDPSGEWLPLHMRGSQQKRPDIEHLFAKSLVKKVASASKKLTDRLSQATPAESFLNKWLLDPKFNLEKSDLPIKEFIDDWLKEKKFSLQQIERWAQSHGIPDLASLSKLGADPVRQLRTLLQWKALHIWNLVSHLQINRQPVGLNAQYVEDRLMRYLPPSVKP